MQNFVALLQEKNVSRNITNYKIHEIISVQVIFTDESTVKIQQDLAQFV